MMSARLVSHVRFCGVVLFGKKERERDLTDDVHVCEIKHTQHFTYKLDHSK